MHPNPRPHAQRRVPSGVSLVEVLICLAILGILSTLAAVPFRASLNQHRIASVRTELIAALQWARWEALRRNAVVALTRRTDCSTPLPGPDDWHCGWHLVADGASAGNPVVLQTFTVPAGLRLVHPGGGQNLQFARSGYPVLVAHKFLIGLPSGGPVGVSTTRQTTTLCMNRTGRVRSVEGQTTC